MEYTHINDCWNALSNAKSLNEVYDLIDNFPRWSGDWNVTFHEGSLIVSNEYFDKLANDYVTDERTLDNILAPDLILEDAELINRDLKTGDIEVDKDIFDDFEEDTYIKIQFSDTDDDTIFIYIMKAETDDSILMEYCGEAELGD